MKILRIAIKKKIWKAFGTSTAEAEKAYKWVIDAPVKEWRTRLWCVLNRYGRSYQDVYEWLIE